MHRCIDLAKLSAGKVAPNPMVGAVLVFENRIIGEGYHEYYGGPHAEVNCIQSVNGYDQNLIGHAVLYVSLEPCAHFGKTPPCTDLIIESRIKKVVVGCRDPFVEVNGKGIEKLRAAGIEVVTGVLEDRCEELNKRFFTFHTRHRPYILLKWAQSQNGKIAALPATILKDDEAIFHPSSNEKDLKNIFNQRLYISNEYTNRAVHQWRSEEASILVGTNTALLDDPELTNRYWPGPSPVRLVIDMDLRLPSTLKMFSDHKSRTIVFNSKHQEVNTNTLSNNAMEVEFYKITPDVGLVQQVVQALYQMNIQSVLIEGGARLLQSFIDENTWDEARIITNTGLQIANGLAAPSLSDHTLIKEVMIISDQIHYFANHQSQTVHRTS